MKRGRIVAVCYDGKFGRRVQGRVLETRQTGRILVEFPIGDKTVQHWFPRRARCSRWGGSRHYYAGYVPHADALMPRLFGTHGDWYSVLPWKPIGLATIATKNLFIPAQRQRREGKHIPS